jgi:hypothetical protein
MYTGNQDFSGYKIYQRKKRVPITNQGQKIM